MGAYENENRHIAMYVNDLEAARDFFVTYPSGKASGLYHNKNTGFRSYFISFDGGAKPEIMNKPETSYPVKNADRTVVLPVIEHHRVVAHHNKVFAVCDFSVILN